MQTSPLVFHALCLLWQLSLSLRAAEREPSGPLGTMVGSLLLAAAYCLVGGQEQPLTPEGRSSLVDMSESYFSGELKCPEGCFAQPVRDDHAGIMRHHLNKAQDFEDTAEESTGENQTKAYEEMYKEIQVRPPPPRS